MEAGCAFALVPAWVSSPLWGPVCEGPLARVLREFHRLVPSRLCGSLKALCVALLVRYLPNPWSLQG